MALRITFKASVSFESDSAPVLTHRAEIAATNAQKAASLAVKAARQVFRGKSPRSIVVVLEEVGRACVDGPAVARGKSLAFSGGREKNIGVSAVDGAIVARGPLS
jgi:hypothetical protein